MGGPLVTVLGLGSIGLRHAQNLIALGSAVQGFDPLPEARNRLAAAGGTAFADRAAALEGTKAAVIASPNGCHRDDLDCVLRLGLHALVEKPLAHSEAGLAELLDFARDADLIVYPAMNQRFHPVVRAVRKLLDAYRVGAPLWGRFVCASYLPEWRTGQDYRCGYAADAATGGVLFDVIHEFDLANHLLGPAAITAASARSTGILEMDSEDTADVMLEHDSGVHSSLHLDYVTRPRRRGFDIGCSGGLIEADLAACHLTVSAAAGDVLIEESWPNAKSADQYRDEMVEFLACLRGEAEPACGAEEALEVLRLVLSARALCGLPTI